MGRFRIRVDGIASMPGLRGHEPDSTFLGEGARRGDPYTTAFALKEFLLYLFTQWGSQHGLLDGHPEKAS
jgi:hypothetical protein